MAAKRIDSTNKIVVLAVAIGLLCLVVGMEYLLRRADRAPGDGVGSRYADAASRIAASSASIERKVARDDIELTIEARHYIEVTAVPEDPDPDDGVSDLEPASLQLTGISYTPEKPLAFVNGRMVTVGQSIDDCEILEIHPDRVRYRGRDGKEHDLRIRK